MRVLDRENAGLRSLIVELSGPPLTPPRVLSLAPRSGAHRLHPHLRAQSAGDAAARRPTRRTSSPRWRRRSRRACGSRSPSLIKAVLLDEREKFRKLTQIRLLAPLLGKGILTSEGADWKWQRQASAPMFQPQDLLGFVPTFVRAAEATRGAVARGARRAVQAIDEDMTRATFDVIAATLLPSADEAFGRDGAGRRCARSSATAAGTCSTSR